MLAGVRFPHVKRREPRKPSTIGDRLAKSPHPRPSPEEALAILYDREAVRVALRFLTPRQELVLRMLYGIDGLRMKRPVRRKAILATLPQWLFPRLPPLGDVA